MGYFSVSMHVGHPNGQGSDMRPVKAVVDTGASDSTFPASLFERLHIEPEGNTSAFTPTAKARYAIMELHQSALASALMYAP